MNRVISRHRLPDETMTDRDIHNDDLDGTQDGDRDGDWIAAWIARQRESLAQSAQGAAFESEAQDLGRRWAETGQAFFDGLRQFATAGAAGSNFDPFDVGQAMLGAWTSVTMLQSGLAEQASQFLRRLPPVGLAREQTEAWRELAQAHAECKRLEHKLRCELAKVQTEALDLLEKRVREHPQRIESFRELYDLWVECGEQSYGKLAYSEAYSKLQAELGNASMRLRARVQKVLEHWLRQLDLPTRSELNSVHRQLRDLRLQLDALRADQSGATKSRISKSRVNKSRVNKPGARPR